MSLILADHDPLARRAVREAMITRQDLHVVAEATETGEALEAVVAQGPDIVLLDAEFPPAGGVVATTQILGVMPTTRVILFCVEQDDGVGIAGLQAGAAGVLPKDIDMSALARAIRGVARGEAAISRRLTNQVVERLRALGTSVHKMRPLKSKLTDRQWEVLDLAAEGLNRAEIAELLDVSVATVRAHMRMALYGLDVETLEQALAKAELLRSGKA